MALSIKLLVLDVDGVLTDGGLAYGPTGEMTKTFNVKDGMGIRQAQRQGVEVALLSGGRHVNIVEARARDLGIKEVSVGRTPKAETLSLWMAERGLLADQVAYIGDDINDLDAMALCGVTACPADAVEDVKARVSIVLTRDGGRACVREFIDRMLKGAV